MKEQKQGFLEKAGKIWTIISIPIEVYLLGHGIYTGNSTEAFLGGAGLVGDFFIWRWLNRDKQKSYQKLPLSEITKQPQGSARFSLLPRGVGR